MKAYYITDTGKVRTHNEDSVMIVKNLTGEHLMVVADGMGGHKAGEVASGIAIECLTNEFYKLETFGNKENAIEWLRNIVLEINQRIFKYTKENPGSKGMGTTLVIAIKTEDYILYGNIGDSSGNLNLIFSKFKFSLNSLLREFDSARLLLNTRGET